MELHLIVFLFQGGLALLLRQETAISQVAFRLFLVYVIITKEGLALLLRWEAAI